MKKSKIYLHKIIYCSLNQKYKIIFNNSDCTKEFFAYFNNIYAKQIAMSSEGITTSDQSQYELFVNLLNVLKMRVLRIVINKTGDNLIGTLELEDSTKNKIKINSYIADAIIIALITFSDMYIDESFLIKIDDLVDVENTPKYFPKKNETSYRLNNKMTNSKMEVLKMALNECVKKENYESAAFLRDRIKELKIK